MKATFGNVVLATRRSCRAFSACSSCFFDLKGRPNNWAGWENWLTVDVVRQLNCKEVQPFWPYPASRKKTDFYIKEPKRVAVEIKVNYLTDHEIHGSWGERPLPDRMANDIRKLASFPPKAGRMLLIATCFESRRSLKAYPGLVSKHLASRPFFSFESTWYECSAGGGFTSLLVLAKGVD